MNRMSDDERYEKINALLAELKEMLIIYHNLNHVGDEATSQISMDFPSDYNYECSMCGKTMAYRHCGMCTHCEQVWNG